MTLGNKISEYRRQNSMTQEYLAEQMGVSAQAVSKWENDLSCPDIMSLPTLAKLFKTTVDELLSDRVPSVVHMIPTDELSTAGKPVMQILVHTDDGNNIRINLPMMVVRMGIKMGLSVAKMTAKGDDLGVLDAIDPEIIISMVEQGVRGRLLEVETEDGTRIEIVLE